MSNETDTVTLTRAEYEALIEQIEDAEDNAFLDLVEARERGQGRERARADYLPAELVRRLIGGEHPIRVWRDHRGMTSEALAAAAGVVPSALAEIEIWTKPGGLRALAKLAAALQISLDDLAPWIAAREE